MTEKATLVVTATPNSAEMASVQEYLKGVMPLLMGAGGVLVKRQKVSDVINGNPCGMVLIMDFGSADAIRELFASDAYTGLIPTRDKGFSEMNILITGDM
ncbi:MAG: DUF1330 domain-containing protein [Novosphingobium sp.]|nr:DUF1330 domain-containing protein [Novosphingobium sp.]